IGTRIPVAAGLAVIAGGLAFGATTEIGDGYGHTAIWLAIVGFGVGLALAPSMEAVLGELPTDESGSGTALTMTLRQVGGALGVALLGSVLAHAYQDRLDLTGLPGATAAAVRDSVASAVALAGRLQAPALAADAQAAYVAGMDVVLLVCAAIALLGAAIVAVALPARAADPASESGHELSRAA
ncbi:MAG TPA: MFS transporter, partial [Micromonosporaceae bacterium]